MPAARGRHSPFPPAQGSKELMQVVVEQGLGYQEGSDTSLTRGQQPVPAASPALGQAETGITELI